MSVNNGSLIRIGQNGYTTRVGTTTFTSGSTAAFGPDGYMYFSTGATTVQVINVATGTLVRTFMLSQSLLVAGGAADWDFKDGYFWSLGGPTIVRVDPTTGVLQSFSLGSNPCGVLTMQAAAAWTYGNGNLGFSCSTTVSIVQIAVTNPSSATPTFQIVSVNNGPPGVIDGTSDPGVPTDLAVVKTGTQWFNAGDTLTYTITVTNNGAGVSTGFVLNDTVPAPLTGVTTDNPGACTVTGNAVRCVGGSLAVGASQAFTIAALSPGTWLACVTNTATLLANEADSNAANNSSSMTSCPSTVPLITCSSNPNLFNTGYNAATGGRARQPGKGRELGRGRPVQHGVVDPERVALFDGDFHAASRRYLGRRERRQHCSLCMGSQPIQRRPVDLPAIGCKPRSRFAGG